jgi:hypothetical protein
MASSGMLRRVAFVRTYVSEELNTSELSILTEERSVTSEKTLFLTSYVFVFFLSHDTFYKIKTLDITSVAEILTTILKSEVVNETYSNVPIEHQLASDPRSTVKRRTFISMQTINFIEYSFSKQLA